MIAQAGTSIRILVVDDHPVVRAGIRGILEGIDGFTVVGEASSGDQGVERARELLPDVILMDLRMLGSNGVGAIEALQREQPGCRVLVLTTYDTDAEILHAINAGATGYILKDAPSEDLAQAIRATAQGQSWLSPAVASRLMQQVRRPGSNVLSAREREVIQQVAQGSSNKEIAASLFVSEATIKSHLIHIYRKLDVTDRTSAVTAALERGYIELRRNG